MASSAASALRGVEAGGKKKGRAVAGGSDSHKTFGEVLRDLLIERGITTGMGNPNWSEFAEQLDGVHYETLRKAITKERAPAPVLMERVAAALGLEPSIFIEYQLYEHQRQFDPREVGFDQAAANLEAALRKRR